MTNAFLNIVVFYYLLMRRDVWFENQLVFFFIHHFFFINMKINRLIGLVLDGKVGYGQFYQTYFMDRMLAVPQ